MKNFLTVLTALLLITAFIACSDDDAAFGERTFLQGNWKGTTTSTSTPPMEVTLGINNQTYSFSMYLTNDVRIMVGGQKGTYELLTNLNPTNIINTASEEYQFDMQTTNGEWVSTNIVTTNTIVLTNGVLIMNPGDDDEMALTKQ